MENATYIRFRHKIGACLDPDYSGRYVLGSACIEPTADESTAVAVTTDGSTLAVTPVDVLPAGPPLPGPVLVPGPVLPLAKHVSAAARGKDYGYNLAVNGRVENPHSRQSVEPTEGRYPAWRDVLPDFRGAKEGHRLAELHINPALLANVAADLGAVTVQLVFTVGERGTVEGPIGIVPYDDDCNPKEGLGVICPLKPETPPKRAFEALAWHAARERLTARPSNRRDLTP